MHTTTLLSGLLVTALATGLAPAQSGTDAAKCVTFDFGGFWPGSCILRENQLLEARGDQRLAASSQIQLATGIHDVAAIPALAPGDPDRVVVVGTAGVSTFLWDAAGAPAGFTETAWTDPAVVGGLLVRAESYPTIAQSLVGVLTASGDVIRLYRAGTPPQSLSTLLIGEPVLDFEIGTDDAGLPRVYVLTADRLSCRSVTNVEFWWQAGNGGDLQQVHDHSAWQVAWLQRAIDNNWQVDMCGTSGLVESIPLPVEPSESVVAVHAADLDDDSLFDLVIKTTTQLVVVNNTPPFVGQFSGGPPAYVVTYPGIERCVPALVFTDAGTHVWLADEVQAGFSWRSLRGSGLGGPQSLLPSVDWIRVIAAELLADSGTMSPPYPDTDVRLRVEMENDWLGRYESPGLTRNLQIVAWRQPGVNQPVAVESASVAQYIVPLDGDVTGVGTTIWQGVPVVLPEERYEDSVNVGDYWQGDVHYWLAVRLCMTDSGDRIVTCSDSLYVGMTISRSQHDGEFPYLDSLRMNNPQDIFDPDWAGPTIIGGGTVGVLSEVEQPPPATATPSVTPPAVVTTPAQQPGQ